MKFSLHCQLEYGKSINYFYGNNFNSFTHNVRNTMNINWKKVDSIVSFLLENDKYLNSDRNETIITLIADNFDLTKNEAEKYLEKAINEIEINGENSLSKALREREFLLQKAKNNKDYKLALEILKEKEKLLQKNNEDYWYNKAKT